MFRLVLFLFIFCLHWPRMVAADSKDQFKTWYEEFGPTFEAILRDNCSYEYEQYLTVPKKDAPIDWLTGGGNTNRLAQPVVNCILRYTSGFILSNMAAAAVVLGLMPTILATVGNSVEETSTLCVIGQRPLLALLVAAASPAIFPTRSFEYINPMGLVEPRRGRLRQKKLPPRGKMAVLITQYLLSVAAIVNTITLCNQLGVQVVSMLAPQLTYMEFVYSIIGIAIHVSAALSLWSRIEFKNKQRQSRTEIFDYIWEILRQQLKPLDHEVWNRTEIGGETYLSTIFSYFTSLLATCHVIYGTMLFSSLAFISAKDSLTVVARYMASAMTSRIILMYELSWLREIIIDRGDARFEETELTNLTEEGAKISHGSRRETVD